MMIMIIMITMLIHYSKLVILLLMMMIMIIIMLLIMIITMIMMVMRFTDYRCRGSGSGRRARVGASVGGGWYIYIYISLSLYIYIYICIERERERDIYIYMYIYIYREREIWLLLDTTIINKVEGGGQTCGCPKNLPETRKSNPTTPNNKTNISPWRDISLEGTKGVPRIAGPKKQLVWSCSTLDHLHVQTLMLTDVQTPFLVTPLRPVHLLRVSLLRVLESNFPGDSL